MIKKILILIASSIFLVSMAILINNNNNEVPVGSIKISNKVNGNFLAVQELNMWDKVSTFYVSKVKGISDGHKGDKPGYVIASNNNLKSICWLPISQLDKTTAFQYVCTGKYNNHYLGIDDNIKSDKYLQLIVRKQLQSGFSWNVNPKDDGTFTYDNSGDLFKGYYIAVKGDGVAKVYFGDIGPASRWYQHKGQVLDIDSTEKKGTFNNFIKLFIEKTKI